MAIVLTPNTGASVYEGQVFSADYVVVDPLSVGQPIGLSSVTFSISTARPLRADWQSSITIGYVSGAVNTLTIAGFWDGIFQGTFTVRTSSETTAIATYTSTLPACDSYHAGYRYEPDDRSRVTVVATVTTANGQTTLDLPVLNDWSRNRRRVQEFAQCGQEDINSVFPFFINVTGTVTVVPPQSGLDGVRLTVTGPDAGAYNYLFVSIPTVLFDTVTGAATSGTVVGINTGATVRLQNPHPRTTVAAHVSRAGYEDFVGSVVVPPSGSVTLSGSGIWTVPADVFRLQVTVVGGGAGGAGGSEGNPYISGGGGGGSGGVRTSSITVIPGQSIVYSVGEGGAGGSNYVSPTPGFGRAGGTTVFGTVQATGGGRHVNQSNNNYWVGSAAGVPNGQVGSNGQWLQAGNGNGNDQDGGNGGSAPGFGAGGAGAPGYAGAPAITGGAGAFPGGGGGGGNGGQNDATNGKGGDGAAGTIIVNWGTGI